MKLLKELIETDHWSVQSCNVSINDILANSNNIRHLSIINNITNTVLEFGHTPNIDHKAMYVCETLDIKLVVFEKNKYTYTSLDSRLFSTNVVLDLLSNFLHSKLHKIQNRIENEKARHSSMCGY